ncbi:MAG: hypothetical protein ACK2UW_03355 [Anaerolineales bacterium]
MSNSPKQYWLTVNTPDEGSEIWVFDEQFNTLDYGLGRISKPMLPGLYKVRVASGTARTEQIVAIENEQRVLDIPFLDFASPAPIPMTAYTHEYHEDAVETESRRVHLIDGQGSAIFVFARRWSEASEGQIRTPSRLHPAAGLSLHRLDGSLLADLSLQSASYFSTIRDPWAACTILVDPGAYLLRLTLPDERIIEQVLIAAPDWMTQVFCLQRQTGPGPDDFRTDLSNATILYRKLDAIVANTVIWFPPMDNETWTKSLRQAELARQGLLSGRNVLPNYVITELLWAKWQNPMLGIFGAHLMLLDPQPEWHFFRRVIENLRRILGSHPDVEALALQSAETADLAYTFDLPPMLSRSWSMIWPATFERPGLIPRDSLVSQVSDRLLSGSQWHQWLDTAAPDRQPSGEQPQEFRLDGYETALAVELYRLKHPADLGFVSPERLEGMLADLAAGWPKLEDGSFNQLMQAVRLPRTRLEERLELLHEKALRAN